MGKSLVRLNLMRRHLLQFRFRMATLLWVVVSTTLFVAGFAVGRRNEQRKLEALFRINEMINQSRTSFLHLLED
jgi:hypothetical protein